MQNVSPLPIAVAAGIGAMLANLLLLRAAWPAGIGDWIGVLALGAVTAAGAYVVLRYLARRRQS